MKRMIFASDLVAICIKTSLVRDDAQWGCSPSAKPPREFFNVILPRRAKYSSSLPSDWWGLRAAFKETHMLTIDCMMWICGGTAAGGLRAGCGPVKLLFFSLVFAGGSGDTFNTEKAEHKACTPYLGP